MARDITTATGNIIQLSAGCNNILGGNLAVGKNTFTSANNYVLDISGNVYIGGDGTRGNLFVVHDITTATGNILQLGTGNNILGGNLAVGKNTFTSANNYVLDISGNVYIGGDGTRGNLFVVHDITTATGNIIQLSSGGQNYLMGNLAIGKNANTSSYILDVAGNTLINGQLVATSVNTVSDYRIKKDVLPLTEMYYDVDKLKPVFYFNTLLNKNEFGFIAHELKKNYPFLVNGDKDDEQYQTVNYIGLIALLTKEIQTHKRDIEGHKQEIEAQKQEIETLKQQQRTQYQRQEEQHARQEEQHARLNEQQHDIQYLMAIINK